MIRLSYVIVLMYTIQSPDSPVCISKLIKSRNYALKAKLYRSEQTCVVPVLYDKPVK